MKAIVVKKYGPPDALDLKIVAKLAPRHDEVLIKVHASSMNSWNWEFLNGTPFINRFMFGLLKPQVGKQKLGADIAGTVEAVGSQVTCFQPGGEVFGDLWDNWGGFTELEPKPVTSSFDQAAAIPQAGVLALLGLM